MLATIKSEIRKLFTVRSTYFLAAIALVLTILFAFYFEGYKGNTGSAASMLAPTALQEIVGNGAGLGVMFVAIIAILFMAHEYRYNTIAYTLTLNTRRTKVLLSKMLVISGFAVVFGMISAAVALGGYMFGLSLRDATLPAQEFDAVVQIARVAFYYVGYAILGILIACLARSVVAAVSTLLLYSAVVEPILGLLLRDNAKYLPVNALDSTVGAAMIPNMLSANAAILVSAGYLVGGLIITWILFVKRDAA
jgi:ABC-2 type transport system permease protein